MMRVWAKTILDHKIVSEVVQEFAPARPSDMDGWTPVIDALCRALDLARPVVMQKHIHDLNRFSHAAFRASDFMEPIAFDRFEIEIFPEKKKENTQQTAYAYYS